MPKPHIKPYPQEQLLIDALPNLVGKNILCTTQGRGQLSIAAAHKGAANVTCHFLDIYRMELAQEHNGVLPSTVSFQCTPDFPTGPFDIVALPTSATGDAELTRDFLQQGHERLKIGGQMLVSTNNSQDTWLHKQLEKIFTKVTVKHFDPGTVYTCIKTEALKKLKNYDSEFAFRDQVKLIHAFSRPGVFSHRELDLGARKLMDSMDIQDGYRVLDIGCGWGAVALAAAIRANNVSVHAIDSNARAIESTIKSAALNHIQSITTKLTGTGEHEHTSSYDIVLANPPYYANFRIAELFAITGAKALKKGGVIVFVMKSPQWYEENLPKWFTNVRIEQNKDYFIASAEKA